jgi:hypothetical protein
VYKKGQLNDCTPTANNNSEVMFRASVVGEQTYKDKVNLSNSSSSDSTDIDVEATLDNVIVSWHHEISINGFCQKWLTLTGSGKDSERQQEHVTVRDTMMASMIVVL